MVIRVLIAAALALLAAAPAARAQVAAPVTAPVVTTVTATGDGLMLTARPDATVDQVVRFRGTAAAGRLVSVALQDPDTLQWSRIARVRADADGTFLVRWRPEHLGPYTVRAESSAPLTVTVYRPALATWYGPGLYGNQTACGIPLTPDLQGVAHRSLPCGTLVAITYLGRSLVVPVVDRGPYGVPAAEWDLTQATAQTLGLTETSTIGAVRLRAPQPVAASR
jgi:rare lipoprotein A